jgi:hypothetical protein
MFKQLISILFLLFCFISGKETSAQTIGAFKHLNDSLSKLESNSNNNGVIALGKLAISKQVDYYYLRIRIAEAYFNLGKYQQAFYQFHSAYLFDKSSLYALSRMRDCAMLNGQNAVNNYLKPSLGISNDPIQKIYVETGTKLSNRTDSIQHTYIAHAGLLLNITKNLETYQGYSFCSQKSSLYNVVQHQYIGLANIQLNTNSQLKLGFSYLHAAVDNHLLNETQQIDNFTEAISLNKQISNVNLGLNAAIGRLNKKEQWQLGANFNYAVTGNDKLAIQFNPILQNQSNEFKLISTPSLTFRAFRNCWINTAYTYANTSNYIEQEGFIVNNNYDLTIDKFSVLLNYKTAKNKDLYLCYQFENKQRQFGYPEINQDYNFNTIIVGYTLKN